MQYSLMGIFLWLYFNKVLNDGKLEIKTKWNVVVPYVPDQNYQVQVCIEQERDTYEGVIEERSYYDLSSTDVWKYDKMDYVHTKWSNDEGFEEIKNLYDYVAGIGDMLLSRVDCDKSSSFVDHR